MPGIREARVLPYSAGQMFDLVADVARYPEFLPWIVATRVRSNEGGVMVADMLIGFNAIREKFTSRVELDRPGRIEVRYIDGPLRDLDNLWLFTDLGPGQCQIDFSVDFAFRNALFERLAGQYLNKAFGKMVAAFEARAHALYGNSSSSAINVA